MKPEFFRSAEQFAFFPDLKSFKTLITTLRAYLRQTNVIGDIYVMRSSDLLLIALNPYDKTDMNIMDSLRHTPLSTIPTDYEGKNIIGSPGLQPYILMTIYLKRRKVIYMMV